MKRVRVSELAERDLDSIWHHIAKTSGNLDIADGVVETITDTFPLFAGTPGAGTRRDAIERGIRGFPVGKYVIYFRDDGPHVVISRVIHGMRDQRDAFTAEG